MGCILVWRTYAPEPAYFRQPVLGSSSEDLLEGTFCELGVVCIGLWAETQNPPTAYILLTLLANTGIYLRVADCFDNCGV